MAWLARMICIKDVKSQKSGCLRIDLCVLNASVNPADPSHSLDKCSDSRLNTEFFSHPSERHIFLNPISPHSFSCANPDRNESRDAINHAVHQDV